MNENLRAMEFIWDRVPKQKDGQTIRYTKADIDYLYYYGFVDTRRVTLDEWRSGVKPYMQEDDSYVLNKPQFLALRLYRYFGTAGEPFDAMALREGAWTDADLKALYQDEIYPSSDLTTDNFWAYLNSWKNSGHVDDKGLIIIDHASKQGLTRLILEFPSPLRRLQTEVQRIRENRTKQINESYKDPEKSGFSVGKTQVEDKLSAYQKLQSKTAAATVNIAQPKAPAKNEVDLKKLRKPTRKIMG